MTRNILGFVLLAMLLAGCASSRTPDGRASGIMDYLHADSAEDVVMTPQSTILRLPLRIGIAFSPAAAGDDLSPAERSRMLDQVRAAFAGHSFIESIEIIPDGQLGPRGGFADLQRVAREFKVDIIALLSRDQTRFTDATPRRYWTVAGTHVARGGHDDLHTLLEAAVLDAHGGKLLFHARGSSSVRGATGRQGDEQALGQLVPNLRAELERFRQRVRADTGVRADAQSGHRGGGDLGWLGLLALAAPWTGSRGGQPG